MNSDSNYYYIDEDPDPNAFEDFFILGGWLSVLAVGGCYVFCVFQMVNGSACYHPENIKKVRKVDCHNDSVIAPDDDEELTTIKEMKTMKKSRPISTNDVKL